MTGIAAASARWDLKQYEQKADRVFAAVTIAATLLFFVSRFADASYANGIATIFAAFGISWSYLRWGSAYSNFDTRTALCCIFGALLFGSIAKFACTQLPVTLIYAVSVFLPILSLVFLKSTSQSSHCECDGKSRVFFSSSDYPHLTLIVVFIIVVSFICSTANIVFAELLADETIISLLGMSRLSAMVFAWVLLWWVFQEGRTLGFSQLWAFVVIGEAVALALICFSGFEQLCYMIISVAIDLTVACLWCVLVDVSHHGKVNSFVIFGAGYGLYAFTHFAAGVLAPFVVPDALSQSYALVSVTVLFVCSTVCFVSGNPFVQRIFSDLGPATAAPSDYSTIDGRCATLARKCDLTSREEEIMKLICRGHSKPYIAETLFITESTVKGHVRHIYKKVNVHSRTELMELVCT